MGFGQKMKVPYFITDDPNRLKRQLANGIPMEQIDVTRDMIDLRFVLRSDVDPKDIKYNIFIEEWTEDNFKL